MGLISATPLRPSLASLWDSACSDAHQGGETSGPEARAGGAPRQGRTWLRKYGLPISVYCLATLSTDAHFLADSADYVESIMAYTNGTYFEFGEFGHLFWRPLGWLVFDHIRPLMERLVGTSQQANIMLALVALSWIAGFFSVWVLQALLLRLGSRLWVAHAATISFIFSHGFLNYSQTGCSYTFAMASLLLGLYWLLEDKDPQDRPWRTGLLAGSALGSAICFWVPYILVVPAALASPLLWFGFSRPRWRQVVLASLACAAFVAVAYAVALWLLGIYTLVDLRAWVSAAAHGTDTRGIGRMVFGLARSFISMGNDGMLVKRYLVGDSYNPVSLSELFRLSLWKLVLFYVFLLWLVAALLRNERGRRALVLSLLGSLPLLAFSIYFDGGAVERYLPLYPFFYIALATALSSQPSMPILKCFALVFITTCIATNGKALAKPTLHRQQEKVASRVRDLEARLKPNKYNRVLTVTWLDELVNFNRAFPFHPINLRGNLGVNSLVTPGTTQVTHWREDFAQQALLAWQRDSEVWVSKQVFDSRPRSDLNWVEGDDPRIAWADFQVFFSQLEIGESVGGEDGFLLVLPSATNEQLLRDLLGEPARQSP